MGNTIGDRSFAWVREMALAIALVSSTWMVASAIGDLKAEMARVAAKVEHNTFLLERNAEALARNAEALARNAEALARAAASIDEANRLLAGLAGQYAADARKRKELPEIQED